MNCNLFLAASGMHKANWVAITLPSFTFTPAYLHKYQTDALWLTTAFGVATFASGGA